MLDNLPVYVSVVFGLTTVLTLSLFFWVLRHAKAERMRQNAVKIIAGLIVWLALQAVLTLQGIYKADTSSVPPKIFLFGILPTILAITTLFATQKGRQFIDGLPLEKLTYLNIVRIPVEIVLFWLYLYKAIPVLMTFEGINFDIIAGTTAPIIIYFGFIKEKFSPNIILIWNIICLLLLLNIIAIAFLSAPSPLQKLSFEQPNIAVLNFPFSWLPTFIVPIVLFGHLVAIRQLLKREK